MENLAQFQRRKLLDVLETMRWDHVYVYAVIERCKRLAAQQKQARESLNG